MQEFLRGGEFAGGAGAFLPGADFPILNRRISISSPPDFNAGGVNAFSRKSPAEKMPPPVRGGGDTYPPRSKGWKYNTTHQAYQVKRTSVFLFTKNNNQNINKKGE